MIVYLSHTFIKENISLKKDIAVIGIFVSGAEILTFTGENIVLKLLLMMFIYVSSCKLIYKGSVHIFELLLSNSAAAFAISASEICVKAALELMHIGFRYQGLRYIFHQAYWYVITHLLCSLVVVLLKKFLVKIHANLSLREDAMLFLIFFGMGMLLSSFMLYPTENMFLYKIGTVLGLIILTAAFLCLLLYFNENIQARLKGQKEKQQLLQLQAQYDYYQQRFEEEKRVRQIYHDMKNHLLILQEQFSRLSDTRAGGQGKEEAGRMIASLQSQLSSYEDFIQTGNAFLDMVIRDKMQAARARKIDFHVEADFSQADFLDGLDISTIFGNALDNALEACEKVAEDGRFITFRAGVRNGYQMIQMENAATAQITVARTSKADSYLHGFGLKNIRSAVEKYEGECQYQYKDGIFSLSILLPLKSSCYS